jgi:hypothetical protein
VKLFPNGASELSCNTKGKQLRRPEFIARQAGHPHGLVGRLLFWVMAAETLAVNERALELLELEPTFSCSEVGFGHGRTLARALELAPNGLVAGIDISTDMVEAFQIRRRRSNARVMVELSREIFVSWDGWYSRQLREIVRGPGGTREKVYGAARLELSAAVEHTEAFTYFCENEARFLRSLPASVPRVRDVFIEFVKQGQARSEVKAGDVGVLADMLSGALCAVALSWVWRRRRGSMEDQLDLIAEACWAMIKV